VAIGETLEDSFCAELVGEEQHGHGVGVLATVNGIGEFPVQHHRRCVVDGERHQRGIWLQRRLVFRRRADGLANQTGKTD